MCNRSKPLIKLLPPSWTMALSPHGCGRPGWRQKRCARSGQERAADQKGGWCFRCHSGRWIHRGIGPYVNCRATSPTYPSHWRHAYCRQCKARFLSAHLAEQLPLVIVAHCRTSCASSGLETGSERTALVDRAHSQISSPGQEACVSGGLEVRHVLGFCSRA